MSRINDITAALATYDLAMAQFADASEDGEPHSKDYEYRDDDAVLFADVASDFIRDILPHLEAIRAGLHRDNGSPSGIHTRAAATALVAMVASSQPGTLNEGAPTHE